VRSLSGDALRRRWQSEFGRPLPRSLTADLLRRMIANRLQEEAFGTLDRATLKLLDGLARRDGARRGERNLKIGTVLVREYQGRRHTVTVALGRVTLFQPVGDRARHHRHRLERPVLRERVCAMTLALVLSARTATVAASNASLRPTRNGGRPTTVSDG
jgi:hypothetical protein